MKAVRVEQGRKLTVAMVASGKRGERSEASESKDTSSVGADAGSRAPGLWHELCFSLPALSPNSLAKSSLTPHRMISF